MSLFFTSFVRLCSSRHSYLSYKSLNIIVTNRHINHCDKCKHSIKNPSYRNVHYTRKFIFLKKIFKRKREKEKEITISNSFLKSRMKNSKIIIIIIIVISRIQLWIPFHTQTTDKGERHHRKN